MLGQCLVGKIQMDIIVPLGNQVTWTLIGGFLFHIHQCIDVKCTLCGGYWYQSIVFTWLNCSSPLITHHHCEVVSMDQCHGIICAGRYWCAYLDHF